ncbi:metallo-beta-lactamase, partial [bacterium]
DAELEVHRLSDTAFVVTNVPFFASNVLVVRMPDGAVVLCSSPMETQSTRALLAWIRAKLRPARIIALNTHFHFDGTGGNEAYREAGVVTYASDMTQALLAQRGRAMKTELARDLDDAKMRARIETLVVVPADHTFPAHDGMRLSFGGEEVRVIYPGPAHSADNVVVHFPARALLFGGCMVKGTHAIGNIGGADLAHWVASVESVRGLGARTIVPGHGPVGGPELIDLTVSVVREALAAKQD